MTATRRRGGGVRGHDAAELPPPAGMKRKKEQLAQFRFVQAHVTLAHVNLASQPGWEQWSNVTVCIMHDVQGPGWCIWCIPQLIASTSMQ